MGIEVSPFPDSKYSLLKSNGYIKTDPEDGERILEMVTVAERVAELNATGQVELPITGAYTFEHFSGNDTHAIITTRPGEFGRNFRVDLYTDQPDPIIYDPVIINDHGKFYVFQLERDGACDGIAVAISWIYNGVKKNEFQLTLFDSPIEDFVIGEAFPTNVGINVVCNSGSKTYELTVHLDPRKN